MFLLPDNPGLDGGEGEGGGGCGDTASDNWTRSVWEGFVVEGTGRTAC